MDTHSLVVGLGASAGGIRARRAFHERVSPEGVLITVVDITARRKAEEWLTGLRLEIEALGTGHPLGGDLRTRIEGVQRHRAALAGGTVDIETNVGSGTTVFMRVAGAAAGTGQ